MPDNRWQRIEALYHAAREREPKARAAFLADACGDDAGLRREVEALLHADGVTWSFIDGNALKVEARQFEAANLNQTKVQGLTGQQIGAYQLLAPLGKGGMGEVYRAKDTRLNREVAIKVLPVLYANNADRLWRFEQEAKAASALNHPNIITIHEIGAVGQTHYIVTELIEGKTLRQKLAAERFPLDQALDIAIQITAALVAAHEAGIIHRDIKPENVMLRQDGIVKVLDFGLAKLTQAAAIKADSEAETLMQVVTQTGALLGTPQYMSPEQARGQKVDARADLFSLGIVLYELITGQPPFLGATAIEVMSAILVHEPASVRSLRQDIPPKLEHIIHRTLRKEPEQRPTSARVLLNELKNCRHELALDAHLAEQTILRPPVVPPQPVVSPAPPAPPQQSIPLAPVVLPQLVVARKTLWVGLAALLLVLLIGGGLYFSRTRQTLQPLSSEFSELFLDLGRWAVPPSGWKIQGERLWLENQTAVGYPADINAGDFTMTFHLRLENAGGAAWALRIKDKNHYYLFYLNGADQQKNETSYFSTYIVRAGNLGAAVSRIPVTTKLVTGGDYTINISAKNNEITHWINSAEDPSRDELGDPLGYFKDESSAYLLGGIGFRTMRQERFSVDELYVRPLGLQGQ